MFYQILKQAKQMLSSTESPVQYSPCGRKYVRMSNTITIVLTCQEVKVSKGKNKAFPSNLDLATEMNTCKFYFTFNVQCEKFLCLRQTSFDDDGFYLPSSLQRPQFT